MTERGQISDFSPLRDGVREAETAEWERRFAKGGVSCLIAALDGIERTLQATEGFRVETETVRKRFFATHRRWIALLSACAKALPSPRGVFVSRADREAAHGGALELLLLAESVKSENGALLADCEALAERTARWERELELSARTLSSISRVLREAAEPKKADLLLRCDTIRKALPQARTVATDLQKRQTRLTERLLAVTLRELPSACRRVSLLADLAHDGERCDIAGLSVLLAALISAAGEAESEDP